MEYLETYTNDGLPTGNKKLRAAIHRDGDWHLVANVWLMNSKGELLIQKRSQYKDVAPGKWDISVAGHVKAGETALTTALRETEEELGIQLQPEELTYIMRLKLPDRGANPGIVDNHFNEIYVLQRDLDLSALHYDSSEVEEVRFMPQAQLEEDLKNGQLPFVFSYQLYQPFFIQLQKLTNF